MSFSIYDASVPVLVRGLANLSKILDKALAQATAENTPLQRLIEARLAPDMRPFPFQIQSACDTAKGCAARLAGVAPPAMADTETTFAELQERIAKTIAFLKTITADQLVGAEDREIVMKFPNGDHTFTGRSYLLGFALPNFYFHVTTAYALLRHQGIAIGKLDYLGAG